MGNLDYSVLDKRLTKQKIDQRCDWSKGKVPLDRRIVVDGTTTLAAFCQNLRRKVGRNKIKVLTILCHGLGVTKYTMEDKRASSRVLVGGFGMEFCKENVTLKTVSKLRALRGLFASKNVGIRIEGCAVAREELVKIVPSGKETKRSFGRQLCKKIAKYTATAVMASSDNQTADIMATEKTIRSGGNFRTIFTNKCIDPGTYKGKVWVFHPDGRVARFK